MKDKGAITRVRLAKGKRLVKRGEVWYLETCQKGRQERRSLGTGDMQEATRRAAEGGEPPPLLANQKPKAPPALTLGKALEEYEDWYRKNRRDTGAERLFPVLHLFVDALGPEKDTKSITRDDVQKWIDGRVDGRSPVTVQGDFARARAFIYWLAKRKSAADPNVCRGIDRPKDGGLTKEAPSPEKVKAILRALRGTWIQDYVTVLIETGMRPTEALGLRGIDLRGKLLSIVPTEARPLKSKWSKRVIELNDTAAAILKAREEKLFKKDAPLFPNDVGEVFKEGSVYHLFLDTLAGEKDEKPAESLRMTLYDFRHFFCSEHAAPGPQHMEIEALAAYIGHSPASTQTLLRWYADQRALRRGAPVSLVGEPKDGKVVSMGNRS